MLSETKYRRDIQVLRGLAVLAVVLFHANESYFPLGYLGVDVFFVISGFVVTPLILRIFTDQSNGGRLSNLRYFYKRRFYRLAPAMAVTFVFSAVTVLLFAPIADHQKFARQGIATLLLAGNVGADRYSGGYFSPNPNPLIHTWSLSVEEQIYIFLPILLILVLHNRRSPKKFSKAAFGFISVLSFMSFLFPVFLQPLYSRAGIRIPSQFSFYSPFDRIWQFTIGGLTFLILDQYQNRIKRFSLQAKILFVIAVVIILFCPIHLSLKASSILATLIAVLVIATKALDVLPFFMFQILTWMGDRSYSIYLIHMPLLCIAKYSPAMRISNIENRLVQITFAIIISIMLGALSYSKIENTFRHRDKACKTEVKFISFALILTLIVPLVAFVSMDIGSRKQYWGIDRSVLQPEYAGFLDPKCLRDSVVGPPCVYRNIGATKTVLLIGDSHAGQISQAVIDTAKSLNWNTVVWTHSGCPIQFQRSIVYQVSDVCLEINSKMKTWVLESKPDLIIVSQFVKSDSSQLDLRHGLSTLRAIVPKLLLIENNPIFPDGSDFMVQRPLIMSAYKPPKEFARPMMRTEDKMASDQLAKWASVNSINTMNFDSLFCDVEVCKRYANGVWLYRDDDHFSIEGAELIIPQLRIFLKQL